MQSTDSINTLIPPSNALSDGTHPVFVQHMIRS